jgi:hypothetical protein
MSRTPILILGVLFVFVAVAAIMVKIMPAPLKDSDFLVIGSVATLVSVLTLFFGLLAATGKKSGVFFQRRKKQK